MNRQFLFVFVVIVSFLTATANAGDGCEAIWAGYCWPDCIKKYCCDDYQPKCLPPVKPVSCYTCDDYCQKPIPCAQPVGCYVWDDYCKKNTRRKSSVRRVTICAVRHRCRVAGSCVSHFVNHASAIV